MEQKTFQNIMDVFSRILKVDKNSKTFLKKIQNPKKKKKKPIRASNIIRKTGTRVRLYQPHKALPKFIFRNYPNEKQNLLKHHGHHTPQNKLSQFPFDFPKIPSIIFSKHKIIFNRLLSTKYLSFNDFFYGRGLKEV